jgi:hypothetical protein
MGTIHRGVWRPPSEAGDFDFLRVPFVLRMLAVE